MDLSIPLRRTLLRSLPTSSPIAQPSLLGFLLPSLSIALPSAINLRIPTPISDLWESILRAVPKKKTSYSKKRSRQLAGKALKDVTELNKCPACGTVKRAHILCTYCVGTIRGRLWKKATMQISKSNRDAVVEAKAARKKAKETTSNTQVAE